MIIASWVGARAYAGAYRRINAAWGAVTDVVSPAGLAHINMSPPTVLGSQFVAVSNGFSGVVSSRAQIGVSGSYVSRYAYISALFVAKPFTGASKTIFATWSTERYVATAGFESSRIGFAALFQTLYVQPQGFLAFEAGARSFVLHPWEYAPPQQYLIASWVGAALYESPRFIVSGTWLPPQAQELQVAVTGWQSSSVTLVALRLGQRYVAVPDIPPSAFDSNVRVYNKTQNVSAYGVANGWYGRPEVRLFRRWVQPYGLASFASGLTAIRNLNLSVVPNGWYHGGHGKPFVAGYIQTIRSIGIASKTSVGAPTFVWGYKQFVYLEGEVNSRVSVGVSLWGGDLFVHPEGLYKPVLFGDPKIELYLRYIAVLGGVHLLAGRAVVERFTGSVGGKLTVEVAGWLDTAFGRSALESTYKTIYSESIVPPRFISPMVEEIQGFRRIYPLGASTYLVSSAQISQPQQFIGKALITDLEGYTSLGIQTRFGGSLLELWVRYVQGRGFANAQHYGPGTTIADRTFYPGVKGIPTQLEFGASDVSHEVRTLFVSGFISAGLGRLSIRNEKRSVFALGAESVLVGVPDIGDGIRFIRIGGLPPSETVGNRLGIMDLTKRVVVRSMLGPGLGLDVHIKDSRIFTRVFNISPPEAHISAQVHNYIRFVEAGRYAEERVDPAEYGKPLVLDRALYFRASSINQWRIGVGVSIYFFVGDIDSVKIERHTVLGRVMVSHRRRTLRPDAFSYSQLGQYIRVRNAAFQIFPIGLRNWGEVAGLPWVLNLNRTFKIPQINPELTFGNSFVAPAVRELLIPDWRGRGYFPQTHWVSLGVRQIKAKGIAALSFEGRTYTEVVERFTRILPKWLDARVGGYGNPVVASRNKYPMPYGYTYSEYGRPRVYSKTTYWTGVGLGDSFSPGKILIRDRRLQVSLERNGILSFRLGDLQVRIRGGGVLFKERVIYVPPYRGSEVAQPTTPKVRLAQIIPSGIASSDIGRCFVYPNAIYVGTGISSYFWGDTLISSPKTLAAESVNPALIQVAEPAFLPYRIFAPVGDAKPALYKAHGLQEGELIDEKLPNLVSGESSGADPSKNGIYWIPSPRVEHQHRSIYPEAVFVYGPKVVIPQVMPRMRPGSPQYVGGIGFRSSRFSWLEVGPFGQEVLCMGWIISTFEGRTVVTRVNVGRQSNDAKGWDSLAVGLTFVENRHRAVFATGSLSVHGQRWGASRVWFHTRSLGAQTLERRPVFGNPRVDFYHRTLSLVGFIALNPYDVYRGDTRVYNRYIGSVCKVKGLDETSFGGVSVGELHRKVSVRGMYAVPLQRPSFSAKSYIVTVGKQSTRFGDVRRYIEGVIQPHEIAMGDAGVPMVWAPLYTQGYSSSVVDCPVVALHVGPQGFSEEDGLVVTVKNEVCCGGCG